MHSKQNNIGGIEINGTRVQILYFVDNIAIITETEEEIRVIC